MSAPQKILPGTVFPTLSLPNVNGKGNVSLNSENGRDKLVIVYRGQFCPFCVNSLKVIEARAADINAAGIDIVVISADDVATSTTFIKEQGFSFPMGCSLTVDMMRQLGLYVSTPKGYLAQAHMFSEPGFYLLTPENIIRYLTVSSNPFGGRVDVDGILMGFSYNQSRAKTDPDFKDYIWGNQ